MKQKELIRQLKQLRKVEPPQEKLDLLEKKIFSRVYGSNHSLIAGINLIFSYFPDYFKNYSMAFASILALLIIVVIGITNGNSFADFAQTAIIKTQIAFSTNTYDKANLSLTLVKKNLSEWRETDENHGQYPVDKLSDRLKMTNTLLSSLNLTGEIGKYTQEQCLSLYKEYYKNLDQFENVLDKKIKKVKNKTRRNKLETLNDQVRDYEQQVENRIKHY